MKITKYGVGFYLKDSGNIMHENWYLDEDSARKKAKEPVEWSDDIEMKYIGTKEVELYCKYCERELELDDDYIKVDTYTRYCSDCYEERTMTYFEVGGEYVGDENEVEVYDDTDCEW